MFAVLSGVAAAVGRGGFGMRGGWAGYGMHGWGFPLAGIIGSVVFAGLVAAVIVLSVRLARKGRHRIESLEILKARYARGEISKAEFEDMKKDLS